MKRVILKTIATILVMTLSLSLLSGCGSQNTDTSAALIDASVRAALDAAEAPVSVTFAVDGKYITVEDAEGLSMEQLLAQAKITLNEGDLLSFEPTQIIGSNITVEVLRVCHVTVTVTSKDSAKKATYHTVLMGGTVADALESVGLKLAKDQSANYKMDDALTDNMEILIGYVQDKPADETTETTPTEDTSSEDDSSDDDWSDDDWSDDDWSDDDWSDDDWSDDDWSDDDWSGGNWSEPETTPPTEPPQTEPPQTEPERYVVSVEVYEDCDGSGHGVKIITYSDGTQEEVYF